MTVSFIVGDTREVVRGLGDGTVGLVACSPPFIALRSYLPDGHPDKHAEIGSEPDPATFLDTLLELTAEWGRVLAPWGSIAIELGDTYAGSGGSGGDYALGGWREGQERFEGPMGATYNVTRDTLGWSDCGHDAYAPGVVLDPFAGTGTTLAVAALAGRDAIGVDIDERNRELYLRRLDECRRALFGVRPQLGGQLDLFVEEA